MIRRQPKKAAKKARRDVALKPPTTSAVIAAILDVSKEISFEMSEDVLVARCFACHAFQTRMASYRRDIDGWRDRVNFMRGAMHFFLDGAQPFPDADADAVTSYIDLLFGEHSVLPPSPAGAS